MVSRSKMGIKYLGILFLACLGLFGESYAQNIGAPVAPSRMRVAPPPVDPDKEYQRTLDRKRARREKIENKLNKHINETTPLEDQLLIESKKPRDYRLLLTISAAYAHISTGGPRKDYVVDPATFFHFYWRHEKERKVSDIQMWYGMRVASFTGTGLYKGLAGRFGFLYFGPMVGIGKIDLAQNSLTQTDVEDKKKRKKLRKQFLQNVGDGNAWFLMTGLSAQTRLVDIDRGSEKPSSEFDNKSIGFDAPGLWAEFSYHWINYGALDYNVLFGIHMGTGKNIGYIGVGAGGFD